MRINSLSIEGFRNLKKTCLEFDRGVSFFAFVGANGQGKTNILECLYLLGVTKSFRTNENLEMIGFKADYLRLEAEAEGNGSSAKLEAIVTKEPPKKTFKSNGLIKTAQEYIGTMPIVFFSPDSIGIAYLAPALRRQYLDFLLSQLNREYLETALKYKHILKQRNVLLRRISEGVAKESDLEFWDKEMAQSASVLIFKRLDYLEKLRPVAASFYSESSGGAGEIEIRYLSKLGGSVDPDACLRAIQAEHRRDIAQNSSCIGPHRDDLQFLLGGRDLASFGSRGEWRSAVLALKHAEVELLRQKHGEPPILLLDDVFSELDEDRQSVLFSAFGDCQRFCTTTHKEFLDPIDGPKKIFFVSEGGVDSGEI